MAGGAAPRCFWDCAALLLALHPSCQRACCGRRTAPPLPATPAAASPDPQAAHAESPAAAATAAQPRSTVPPPPTLLLQGSVAQRAAPCSARCTLWTAQTAAAPALPACAPGASARAASRGGGSWVAVGWRPARRAGASAPADLGGVEPLAHRLYLRQLRHDGLHGAWLLHKQQLLLQRRCCVPYRARINAERLFATALSSPQAGGARPRPHVLPLLMIESGSKQMAAPGDRAGGPEPCGRLLQLWMVATGQV